MEIELNRRKVWGSGFSRNGQPYGDIDWKDKIKALISDQDYVIVEGRYGENNLDFHYNIKGIPFSQISLKHFLQKLESINLGFGDDVYIYDAFDNEKAIWTKKLGITEKNRYIFVSHLSTEVQML